MTRRAVLALALTAVLWPQDAGANPDGGTVVGGTATIVETSPSRLDIMQATDRVIIDWRSFSIGEAEHTNFAQPSMDSVALNRVIGGDLSTIAGRLSANGNILLINPNGVIFTSTARVDVHGLIASTSNIDNDDFMAGRLDFSAAVDPSSFVINRGEITAADGGLVALVAPWVENSGVIAARLGRVELASGGAFTVDLYGDGLIQLALAEAGEVPDELSSAARVSNLGLISADGGVVALTVADAQNLVDNVINMEGIIEARTVEQSAGRIVLNGGATGIVSVTGTLDASGRGAGEIGGEVAVLGEKVGLFDGAVVDVSGDAGGGTALIGGNYQGSGPELNAQFTYLSSDMRIDADALTQGDGGTVIVWAEQGTHYEGTITARGGAESGDGGFVEVSGKESLEFLGSVDLAAPNGANGTLLLDPNDITIVDVPIIILGNTNIDGDGSETDPFTTSDDGAVLDVDILEAALASGNVVIQTGTAGSNTEDGDITILTTILSSDGNDLTLLAHDDIIFADDPDSTAVGNIDFSASTGSISLLADGNSSDGVGAIINNSSASFVISMGSGGLELVAGSGIGTSANPITVAEDGTVAATTTASGGIFLEFNFNNDISIGTVGATIGVVSAGDVSLVNLEGSFSILQDIVAGGSVTVNSTFADVTATADIFAGGDGGFIDIDGNVVRLAGLDTLGVADANVADSGDVNIDGKSITVTSTILTGGTDGDVVINSTGNVSLAGIDTTAVSDTVDPLLTTSGLVEIDASGSVTSSGDILTGGTDGDVRITSGTTISLAGVDTRGASTLVPGRSSGEVVLNAGLDLTVAGDILTGGLDGGVILDSGGNIAVAGIDTTFGSDIDDPGVNDEGIVSIDALAGSVTATGDILTGGAFGAVEIDALTIELAGIDTRGVANSGLLDAGDVDLSGDQVTVTGTIFTGGSDGDVFVHANAGNLSLAGIDTTAAGEGFVDIETYTSGSITLSGNIVTGGSFGDVIVFADNGDISLVGIDTTAAGEGFVDIEAFASGSIDVSGSIVTGGSDGSLVATANEILVHDVATVGSQTYNAAGDVVFASDYTTGGGDFTVNGDLVLLSNTSVTTLGGNITFAGTVNGVPGGDGGSINPDLTLDAGAGAIAFAFDVGAIAALTNLSATGGTIDLRNVTTLGDQTYTGTVTYANTFLTNGGNFTANGTASFATGFAVTTGGGDFTVGGPATLLDDLSIATAGGDITFASTIDGGHDLALNAATGTVLLQGDVGALVSLSNFAATGATVVLAGSSYAVDAGFAVFSDALLQNDVSILTDGGVISFFGAIDGPHELVIEAGVLGIVGLGTVGATTALTGLDVTARTIFLNDVTTNGAQTYTSAGGGFFEITFSSDYVTNGGDFTVNGDTALFSDSSVTTAGGNITFNGTIDGTFGEVAPVIPDLTLSAGGGAIALQGNVGASFALASLTATGVTIDLSDVTTLGDQTYNGAVTYANTFLTNGGNFTANGTVSFSTGFAVTTGGGDFTVGGPATLLDDVSVATAGGGITFESTIDGAFGLALDAGAGTVGLQGAVGASIALASLTATGATIDLGDVTTAGAQTYNGAVTFASTYTTGGGDFTVNGDTTLRFDTTVTTGAGGGNITFAGTIDTDIESLSPSSLTLSAGAGVGAIALQGNVGATLALASLSAAGATIDLSNVTTLGDQTYSGAVAYASTFLTNGGDFTANGSASFATGFAVTTGGGDFTVGGPATLLGDLSVATAGGGITFASTIDGGHDLALNAGTGAIGLQGAVGSTTALASLSAIGATIDLTDVATIGAQTYNGAVTFASTYTTGGGNFTVNGDTTLLNDTSIGTAGGDITFNGTVDGALVDFADDLTLSSGSGAVTFNGLVGNSVVLGVVDATGSSSLTASGNLLITGFQRVVDDPLPPSFDVLRLLPGFVLPTDPNVINPPNILGGPSISTGNPARPVDISPVPNSLQSFLTLAALGEIAPGAGTDGGESVIISEVDSEMAAEALELIMETCPDVILTSLAWQNTPADAAFNRNPMLLPYSVDEYCAGYVLTIPGRGSAESYQGLTFVRRDFWTDLKQSRDEEIIAEIRGDFGLPEQEGQ